MNYLSHICPIFSVLSIHKITANLSVNHLMITLCYFQQNCKEPVMSLKCGIIGAQETDEIVVATYSGRIFGLTQTTDGDTQLQGDSTVAVNNFPQVTKLK